MRVDILSLFPGYFQGPFNESMIKRARDEGILDIHLTDIRDFAEGKHKQVDDRPYGGGPGMVLMAEPVVKSIRQVKTPKARTIFLTPQGRTLTAKKCESLATYEHLILLCGHYEGIDERAIELEVDEEISIGDYVLTNGCAAAVVLLDAVSRFIPGVIGHSEAAHSDSFHLDGAFDYPSFTRPRSFEGKDVPEVLLGGNHREIKSWRESQAKAKTLRVRPDLIIDR